MEIKKLECPSCGAILEWNTHSCNFCKTELRYFENNSAVLPMNLTVLDIENNIVNYEKEFWNATLKAMDAPYSKFKELKDRFKTEQDIKNDIFNPNENDKLAENLKMFYETFLILPSENLVDFETIRNNGNYSQYVFLTSLRIIYINTNSFLSIPLEKFKSWKVEKSVSGHRIGLYVLRYYIGDKEEFITFDPDDNAIMEGIIQAVIACKEWEDLSPFQRNLLVISRYNINKSYKIQVKPFEMMQYNPPKKGCFVATVTLGDYNHPKVLYLRSFRDNYLIKRSWGRSFIKWYYKNGPILASKIEKSYVLKKLSYWFIISPSIFISKILKHF